MLQSLFTKITSVDLKNLKEGGRTDGSNCTPNIKKWYDSKKPSPVSTFIFYLGNFIQVYG